MRTCVIVLQIIVNLKYYTSKTRSLALKSSTLMTYTSSLLLEPGAGGREVSTRFLFPFPSVVGGLRFRVLAGVALAGVVLAGGDEVDAEGDIGRHRSCDSAPPRLSSFSFSSKKQGWKTFYKSILKLEIEHQVKHTPTTHHHNRMNVYAIMSESEHKLQYTYDLNFTLFSVFD